MGGPRYNVASAYTSRDVKKSFTKTIDQNFTQNKLRKAHNLMKSQGIILRESRDNEQNPLTIPIIFVMDLTGSMGSIPQHLIQDGLPKLVGGIIQKMTNMSPAILFLGVGDHECDDEPLQVGQFESGDKQLDMWLERTYLEGGGGGNDGESYGLAHYFAAFHTATDHWDKRGKKGILITVGDEPNLRDYPASALKGIMGSGQHGYTDLQLLEAAQEKWEVYHINPKQDFRGADRYWKQFLGDHYLQNNDYKEIPKMVTNLVLEIAAKQGITKEEVKHGANDNIIKPNEPETIL
jgi:hypothetical protein